MKKIVSIGAGNVASHLLPHLHKNGYDIIQIFSQNLSNANKLAKKVKAIATNQINKISSQGDIYIFLVPDDIIKEIAANFPFSPRSDQIICHSSGSVSSKVISRFPSYGVIYPVQSFSKAVKLKYNQIPFCITANQKKIERRLISLAEIFSKEIHVTTDAQRKTIHLSAVIANNFVNHLFFESSKILEESALSFDLIKPLIKETVRKAFLNNPRDVQTGPAKRNDKRIISEHTELLEEHKQLQKIYKLISKAIKLEHQ